MNISVIVCCHNSAGVLKKTLNHLFEQKTESETKWEIILVDNNSTDQTQKVAKELYQASIQNIDFTILEELKPGLSNARMRGILNAKGETIVFCDDDNAFNYNYLSNVDFIFRKYKKLGCVGPGIIEAVDLDFAPIPIKFQPFFQEKSIQGELNLGGPAYGWKNMPAGTGMCIRHDVAEKYIERIQSGVYQATDRKGKTLSSGGDTQIVYEALKMGYDIGVSDLLKLQHLTINKKLKRPYIHRLYFGVNSCHQAHAEAWPELADSFRKENPPKVPTILWKHFRRYHYRSFRLGKFKHLIRELANRYGILSLKGEKDAILNVIIWMLRLK